MDALKMCVVLTIVLLLPSNLYAGAAVFANGRGVAAKESGPTLINDVFKGPVPMVSVPIPYPNIGKDPVISTKVTKEPAVKIIEPDTGIVFKEPTKSLSIKEPTSSFTIREPVTAVKIREPVSPKAPASSPSVKTSLKPISIKTPSIPTRIKEPSGSETGMAPVHAYKVLGTVKSGGKEYVVTRNPWGKASPDSLNSDVDGSIGDAYLLAALAALAPHFEAMQSLDTQNKDKSYWVNMLRHANRITEIMGDYLPKSNSNEATGSYGNSDKSESSNNELMSGTKGMSEMANAMSLQELQLQVAMQKQNRAYTTVSNIMKVKHDTTKTSIDNVR